MNDLLKSETVAYPQRNQLLESTIPRAANGSLDAADAPIGLDYVQWTPTLQVEALLSLHPTGCFAPVPSTP